MTNENNTNGEEEYQFPKDEYVADDFNAEQPAAEEPEQAQAAQSAQKQKMKLMERFPFLRNKRIVGVVLGAIIIIVAFDIYHSISGNKTQVIQTPPPAPVVKAPQPAKPQYSQLNPQALGQLEQVKQDAALNEQSVAQMRQQLQSHLNNLQTAVNHSHRSIVRLNSAIISLAGQMKQLDHTMLVLEKKLAKKHHHKIVRRPEVKYTLKAILPGRAWIMGSNGISDSVQVGQHLKNYGVIESIDPNRGLVLTSSGKVIEYNPNNS